MASSYSVSPASLILVVSIQLCVFTVYFQFLGEVWPSFLHESLVTCSFVLRSVLSGYPESVAFSLSGEVRPTPWAVRGGRLDPGQVPVLVASEEYVLPDVRQGKLLISFPWRGLYVFVYIYYGTTTRYGKIGKMSLVKCAFYIFPRFFQAHQVLEAERLQFFATLLLDMPTTTGEGGSDGKKVVAWLTWCHAECWN